MSFILKKPNKITNILLLFMLAWAVLPGYLNSMYKEIAALGASTTPVLVSPCQQSKLAKSVTGQTCQENTNYFSEDSLDRLNAILFLSATLTFNYVLAPLILSPINSIFRPPKI